MSDKALKYISQQNCGCPIPRGVQRQVRWIAEQPGLVGCISAHIRSPATTWPFRFLPTQTILWPCYSIIHFNLVIESTRLSCPLTFVLHNTSVLCLTCSLLLSNSYRIYFCTTGYHKQKWFDFHSDLNPFRFLFSCFFLALCLLESVYWTDLKTVPKNGK